MKVAIRTQVLRLYYQGIDLIKNGKTLQGISAINALEKPCNCRTFILNYAYPGQSQQVKQQIVDMALNSSGIGDTARVLHDITSTVLKELKK